jgi:hypothetical protein
LLVRLLRARPYFSWMDLHPVRIPSFAPSPLLSLFALSLCPLTPPSSARRRRMPRTQCIIFASLPDSELRPCCRLHDPPTVLERRFTPYDIQPRLTSKTPPTRHMCKRILVPDSDHVHPIQSHHRPPLCTRLSPSLCPRSDTITTDAHLH